MQIVKYDISLCIQIDIVVETFSIIFSNFNSREKSRLETFQK